MKDLISVIIPIYNAEKYLDELLDCVVKQTYENLEILLINDGSTDCGYKICEKYYITDKRIHYFENENHGVSFSRNFGIEKSLGKYIVFIDADDIISYDFIETLYSNLIDNNVDCSICGIVGFKAIDQLTLNNKTQKEIFTDKMIIGLFKNYGGFLANKMYKKEIIEANNIRLNENIHISEDLLFNFIYFKFCKKVLYDNGIKYFYRIHENSSFYNLNNTKWFSVIDTYNILLEDYVGSSDLLRNVIVYNALITICESKYRIKRMNNQEQYRKKIENLEKKCLRIKYNLTLIQKIKLFLFRNFPNLVMEYKKIKTKG